MTHRITHDRDTYQPVGMGWGNFSWLKWDHFATIAGVWPSFSTGRRKITYSWNYIFDGQKLKGGLDEDISNIASPRAICIQI